MLTNYLAEIWGISITIVCLALLMKDGHLKKFYASLETEENFFLWGFISLVIGVTMIFFRWGWTVHRILAKSSMTLFLVMAEDKLHSRQEVRQHICGDSFCVLAQL